MSGKSFKKTPSSGVKILFLVISTAQCGLVSPKLTKLVEKLVTFVLSLHWHRRQSEYLPSGQILSNSGIKVIKFIWNLEFHFDERVAE